MFFSEGADIGEVVVVCPALHYASGQVHSRKNCLYRMKAVTITLDTSDGRRISTRGQYTVALISRKHYLYEYCCCLK